MRGYIVFGDDAVLDVIDEKKASLEQQTAWFEKNRLYKADEVYASDIRSLYNFIRTLSCQA